MSDVPSSAVEMEIPGEASSSRTSAAARAPVLWPRRESPAWRYALLRRMLAVADMTAVLIATVSLAVLHPESVQVVAWSLVCVPLWVPLAKLLGLYDADRPALRHLTVDEMPRIILWAFLGTSLLSVLLEATPAGHAPVANAITFGVVVTIAAVLVRAGTRRLWRAATPPERVAVIGSEDAISILKRKLDLFPDLHMTIEAEVVEDQLPLRGAESDACLNGVERVIYTPSHLVDGWIDHVMDACRATGAAFNMILPSGRVLGSGVRLSHLAEVAVLEYRMGDLSRSSLLLKRVFDVAVSAVSLVLLLPFFAVIAVAIKLDSPGPVFFSQLRAGVNGRPFRMRKFRSMSEDAEQVLPELIDLDALIELRLKVPHDPRITQVGGFLRRWSLDELPQLFNVLKGDMSLVGPRPEQLPVVARYSRQHLVRLAVKPGITGPMQVYGRGDTTWDERLALERDYVENLTIGGDLRIIGLSLSVIVRGNGAT